MKITIDTKEDSKEEIKKLINLLSSLVGGSEVIVNKDIFGQETSQSENILGNIFETKKEEGLGNKEGVKEEKDENDIPDIQIY